MKKNCLHKILMGVSALFVMQSASAQTIYTSVAPGDFNNQATWGASIPAETFLDGSASFVVKHNVTIGDSIKVANLTVQDGGKLTFGRENETFKCATVTGKFLVNAACTVDVADLSGTRVLQVAGDFENNGVVEFRKSTNKVVNVVFNGTSQHVKGSGTTKFNNFEVASGTVTADMDLDIDGAFTIGASATKFTLDGHTMNLAGNFTKNASAKTGFDYSSGKIIFDGTTVQSVSGNGNNNFFYDIEVSGGGFLVLSCKMQICGNFVVKDHSTVSTSASLRFYKNFTVEAGSTFDSNTEYTCFWGSYTSENDKTTAADRNQTIILDGDVTFAGISCRAKGSEGIKTFHGNINSTAELRAWATAKMVDDGTGYHHTFVGAVAEGGIYLQSPMTIAGGTIRYNDSSNGEFTLGSGDITLKGGSPTVKAGDTFRPEGNVTLEANSFVLNGTYDGVTELTAQMIGKLGKAFVVNDGTAFYLKGHSDNYPTGFGTITIGATSTTYYNSNFDQTVHAADYGHLYLQYKNKTFDGPTNIAGHLYVYSGTNDEISVNMGRFEHTIGYNIADNPDVKGKSSILSTGTVTMNGNRAQVIYKRTDGTYEFNNLIFTSSDPTNSQTKTISGNIKVDGELKLENASTNEQLFLALDIDDYVITGSGSGDNQLVLGNNTRIKVSGADNLGETIGTFGNVELDKNSIVIFDATKGSQNIPVLNYGNISLYGSTVKKLEGTTTVRGWINVSSGTPILTIEDESIELYIEGDWKLAAANLNINPASTIVLCGIGNQEIVSTKFPNLQVRGNGVKTLKGTLTIEGDLSVYSGCEFNADNRTINLYGDFDNTDGGGGIYHQDYGRLNLNGATHIQNVACSDTINTRFYNVYIDKKLDDTVRFQTDVFVGNNMMTTTSKGNFDIDNHRLIIGGDFYLYKGCKFVHTKGASLHFTSSEAEQSISNSNTENTYPTMRFTGSAVKALKTNEFDINGDVIIDHDAIVTSSCKLWVSGDWKNAGTFNHSSEVIFDRNDDDDGGGNQYISSSAFSSVTFAGTGRKMLTGMINVSSQLKIDSLSTLEVSPDGGTTCYEIKVGGTWKNNVWGPGGPDHGSTGKFIPHKGTVTFVGNSSYIYTGDSIKSNNKGRDYKSFYNVVINNSDPTNYKGLYPIYKVKNSIKSEQNDMYVENNFTINTGIFYVYWNTLYVGANLWNLGGTFSMNTHYRAESRLLLGGAAGGDDYEFDPGESNTIRQIEVVGGGKYNLMSDYTQYTLTATAGQDSLIHIRKGEFCLNGHTITFNENGNIRIEKGGTLNIDAGATLAMLGSRYLINSGGTLRIVGTEGNPATIQAAAVDNYYYIRQDSGKIYADNYCIEGTNGNGLNIIGGTIDETHNLSNGMFSNSKGAGTNALLTIGAKVVVPAGLKIENVSFNGSDKGPLKNVKREGGSVPITLVNYSGSLAGAENEVDTGDNLIIWEEPTGFVWTGEGDGKSWHDGENWAGGEVPGAADEAYLKFVSGKNNIKITSRADVKTLTIDGNVTLTLNGEDVSEGVLCGMRVRNKLTMMKSSKLVQTGERDSLILNGSWISSGTYTPNNQPTVFDLQAGVHQLSIPAGQPMSTMILKGSGSLSLLGTITINENIILENDATLMAGTGTINIGGDWINNGGIFDEGESKVIFNADSESKIQTISGGKFWRIDFTGKSKKVIASDISVRRYFIINKTATEVDAGTSNIHLIGRPTYWYNYKGETAFAQSGDGAVICSGSTVYFGKHNDDPAKRDTRITTFNNIILQGTGTKHFYDTTNVKGSVEMVSGVDVVIGRYGSINGVTDNSTFISYGGALLIYGEDNFPKDMNTELVGGSVYYRDSIDQIISPAQYYNLVLRNEYKGSSGSSFSIRRTTKTMSGDISVVGTLNINDSLAILDVDNHKITLTGTIAMATNGKQIRWGDNGTLDHIGGSWDVSANITDFCNVYKHGTGYLYASSDWNVTGDMEFDPETRFYMRGNKITGQPDKHFKMSVNCQLHSSVEKSRGVAFPQGFGSYLLDETTTTYLEASADQTVYTQDVVYGALYLNASVVRTVDFDGDLTVRGNFTNAQDATTVDAQDHRFYLWGASNDLRNYRTDTTLYLLADGDQKIATGGNCTELNLKNIELSGSGVKELDDTKVNISGTIKIASGTSFSTNDAVVFSGDTIDNKGTFRHYGSSFTFDGDTTHYIFMGADNIFNGIIITDNDTVVIKNNGITLNAGTFSIGKKSKFLMGGFTHYLASPKIELADDCEWDTKDATLVFNRNTTQNLPAITCENIQFSNAGSKILEGDLHVGNLTIDEGVTFSVGSTAAEGKTVYVKGNWICNGSFTSQADTVYFDSQTTEEKRIKANNQSFNVVVFNKYTANKCTYKLEDQMTLKDGMTIGKNATFHLNKNILVVGNDDANSTEPPYVPDGEYVDVLADGELYVDGGASLQFNHQDDNTHLRVYGKLSLVGETNANAVIGRSTGSNDRGTEIDIYGEIAANYYQIQYVAPTGFNIHEDATIDPTNNLSNGIWSNMYTSTSYKRPKDKETVVDTFIYLIINARNVANPNINNLSFNHGGTPTIGTHFNMLRDSTLATAITLGGTINGGLGTQYYEMHAFSKPYKTGMAPRTHKINWPDVAELVWTGRVSSDWFDMRNWFPMEVPTAAKSVRIPLTANAPIIYNNGAVCNDLIIVNGSLTIEKGLSAPALKVEGSVDVQDGGVFAIEDDAVVDVYGDWNIATRGYFVPQNGTVRFKAAGGSVTIAPHKSDFNNVSFDGAATFMLSGSSVNFNGNVDINQGTLWPSTASYVYSVKGNYTIAAGGAFNNVETGFIKFDGVNQTITNGKFSRVRFSNEGTKTIAGTFDATYNSSTRTTRTIIVEDNATLLATSPLTIKGNMLIDGNATFNDGNQQHTFTGYYWEAPKDKGYVGSGKIVFNGNHAQYIWGGKFHDIDMTLSTKYISADATMTGNLTLEACNLDMLTNHISGDGTFEMTGTKTINVYARGENNYPTFANYEVSGTSCYSYYNGPMNQTIRGGDNVRYGYLYMNSDTYKTLEGDIIVLKNLNISENGGTLDANNKNIYLAGHWYNQTNGRFIPGKGRVIFNGSTGNQYAYLGVSVDNPFYDIEVAKTGTNQFYAASVDLTVGGSLYVKGGKMNCVGGYRVRIGGDVEVSSPGVINNSGCYELYRPTGTCNITTAGSILNDLVINGAGCEFVVNDDLKVYGNFTLQNGTFNQNGNVVTLGNSYDNSLIYGTYIVGPGGKLRIGSASSFVVKAGGTFEAVGDNVNYAQITNDGGSNRYYFTVEGGLIKAEYYSFSYLAKQGIIISKDATIHGVKNFSHGIFSNVVSAGVCIDIRNDQEFIKTDSIVDISFPNNPGGGAVNIKKTESSTGSIDVYNATGLLAGELYENDPHGLINWKGDVEYIWTAGANTNNWWDPMNWTAKLNGVEVPHTIPGESNNVIIPSMAAINNKYPIIDHSGARAKKLTINKVAELTIKLESEMPDTLGYALIATSDITVNGTLTMTSELDKLQLYGNWVIGTSGKLIEGAGTVEMIGVGVKTIQNKTLSFNNLLIDNIGTVQAQSALKVGGNFEIRQGTFDVGSYDVTVGGNFTNNGTFMPQTRTLIFSATPGSAHTFNPGRSTYNNVQFKSGNYSLTDNELYISHNIELDGGSLTVGDNAINLGDGTGVDNLNIAGTLYLVDDGKLKMGNNAYINVKSGGLISLVGSENHEAIVTSQKTTGTYSFTVNGEIAARYYKIERLNADGLHLKSGSTINAADNLSNGQYSSGTAGGCYMWLENNLAAADAELQISNVYFNAGAKYNVKRSRLSSVGNINIRDAVGVIAGYYFENDVDEDKPSAISGAVRWSYSGEVRHWIGNKDMSGNDDESGLYGNLWSNPKNWDNGLGQEGTPNAATRVFIPLVEHGVYPVIDRNCEGDVEVKGIDVYSGASLEIKDGKNLAVTDPILGLSIGENATFTASDGATPSTVTINGQFANSGKFIHGGSSKVIWSSSSNRDISMNGYSFYDFEVQNVGGATVTFTVESGKPLKIENNFTISGGNVNCNGGVLEVGGNFTKTGGNFIHGEGTVRLNGGKEQTISSNTSLSFYNLELIGTNTKNIGVDIEVVKDITVGTTVKALGETNITCRGNWNRPASGSQKNNFIGGAGAVIFAGTVMQDINKPETFTNVTFNNPKLAAFSTTYTQTISGVLTLTHGILKGNASNPICLTADATIVGGSPESYINGTVEKEGSADFHFPIGGNDRYAPIEIFDLGASGKFQVGYHSDMPDNQTNLDADVNQISKKEYWTLNRNSGTTMPKVKLYWYNRTYSGLKDMDVVSVVLYKDNKWTRQIDRETEYDSEIINALPGFEADTMRGFITTRVPIAADGKLTFGFTYPTITWLNDALTDAYSTKSNWSGKYAPSEIVNIRINEVPDGNNTPKVTSTGKCYDMTINEGGKLEVASGATLTVFGNATIHGELTLAPGAKINFMKDVSGADGKVLAAANSEVYICSETDQNVALDSCYNIVFEGGLSKNDKCTKTLTSDIKVAGSINVKNYTTLAAGSHTISLGGNLTITTYGDFINGTSTLELNGSEKQILSITPNRALYNLTINNSSPTSPQIDLGSGIKVTGNLNLIKGKLHSTSSSRLILAGAKSTIGNSDSYVIGEMERDGSGDFVFPIGSERGLAQIGISGTGATSYFMVAEYRNSKPQAAGILDEANVQKISHLESWHLSNKNDIDAKLTLYWNDSEYSEITNKDELLVAVLSGGKWYSYGFGGSTMSGDGKAGTVTSGNVIKIKKGSSTSSTMRQGVSRRTLASAPVALADEGGVNVTFGTKRPDINPLPIELISFDAEVTPNNTDVALTWSTASEHNNDYFTIEHMFDGELETVDTIAAKGGAGEGADYDYLHINQSAGTHYYRLLQTDFDGTVTVAADWVAVVIENADKPVLNASVAPNPGQCQNIKVSVSGISGSKLRYVVADMSGQTIVDHTVGTAGMSTFQIDATDWNLQPAMYLIKIFTDNGQTVSKFVVE